MGILFCKAAGSNLNLKTAHCHEFYIQLIANLKFISLKLHWCYFCLVNEAVVSSDRNHVKLLVPSYTVYHTHLCVASSQDKMHHLHRFKWRICIQTWFNNMKLESNYIYIKKKHIFK